MKYAFFAGCVIPQKENAYELSTRKVAEKLEIEFIDLEGANCCGYFVTSVDRIGGITLAARNLALAEELDCDLAVLCNGCFGHLSRVRHELLADKELLGVVNEALATTGRRYEGKHQVKHFCQILVQDVGIARVRKSVVRPLIGLRVAPFYGCHLLKPSDEIQFDDPERPGLLNSLVDVAGVRRVDYLEKKLCCGGPLLGVNEDLSLRITRQVLKSVQRAHADAMVTNCPFCHLQFDLNQMTLEEKFSEAYQIPVLHYTQLLGLAQGLSPEEVGLSENRVPADTILEVLESI